MAWRAGERDKSGILQQSFLLQDTHYQLSGAISRRVLKDSLGHAFKEMGKTETIPICQKKKLRPIVDRKSTRLNSSH